MPKQHRLSSADLKRLRPEKRLHGALFSLSITRDTPPVARIACAVSKKVALRANVRNAIKRRARNAIRSILPSFPTGYAYVFNAKREAVNASYTEIKKDIESLAHKCGSVIK